MTPSRTLLPLVANPATGHERAPYAFDYALWFTPSGDWRENGVDAVAHSLSRAALHDWEPPAALPASTLAGAAAGVVTADRPDVLITAVKAASRGEGLIVRLETHTTPGPPVVLALPRRKVEAAALCDARERDLATLKLRRGRVHLTMPGNIATVRLLLAARK